MASRSISSHRQEFWYIAQDINGQGAQFEPDEERDEFLALGPDGRAYLYDFVAGTYLPKRTPVFRHVRKSRWYDMLWSGTTQVRIVSERFVEVLENERASGWRTYPLVLLDRKGVKITGYCGLAVTSEAGPLLWKRSKRVWKPPAVPSGEGYWNLRGLWFNEGTWDGSTLFRPQGSGYLMGTEGIVRAMKKANLKGIEFIRQSDFEIIAVAVDGKG